MPEVEVANNLLKLSEKGIMGIIIALVIVILVLIFLTYKMAGNHISHSTESNIKLAKSLTDLSGSVRSNTMATKELKDEIKYLKR